jgi:hypothetical protein
LRPGELAYVGSTNEIWRMEPSGALVRLVGSPGETVLVTALGTWDGEQREAAGAHVTYDGSRWKVTDAAPRAINRNPTLRAQPDGTVRGWDILSRSDVTVQPERHPVPGFAPDGWLQVESRSGSGRLGVRTGLDRDDASDGPLMAVVSLRAFGAGRVSVRIGAAGPANTVVLREPTGTEQVEVPAIGRWETLTVRVEQDQLEGGRVAVLVELLDTIARDRLDIGKVEVFAARLP